MKEPHCHAKCHYANFGSLNVITQSDITLNLISLTVITLFVIMPSFVYAECRYPKCRYAGCQKAKCRHDECRVASSHCQDRLSKLKLYLHPLNYSSKTIYFGCE